MTTHTGNVKLIQSPGASIVKRVSMARGQTATLETIILELADKRNLAALDQALEILQNTVDKLDRLSR